MSGSCIIPLLRDYNIKGVKSHTFKLKRDDNTEKETFDVEKCYGVTIEILYNAVLLCQKCLQGWSLQCYIPRAITLIKEIVIGHTIVFI